jgi:hypothetical protein
VANIFGFKPGDSLEALRGRYAGIDIFLSTICAVRLLSVLSLPHVARLATLLEATILFRPSGKIDELFKSLQCCDQEFQLGFQEEELIHTFQEAVDMHNRVSGNVATEDLAEFLDHLWRVMPETDEELRKSSLHTVQDFYNAIRGTLEWVQSFDLSNLFANFGGIPSEQELHEFQKYAARNVAIGSLYLQVRVFAVAIVAAFATLTGGDAPRCFFFGDLPFRQDSERLGDGLETNPTTSTEEGHLNKQVFDILRGELMSETGFDTRNAPLAAFVYQQLGTEVVSLEKEHHQHSPWTQETSLRLLKALPYDLVCTVGREIGRIAIPRQKAIERVLQELKD